MLDLSFVLDLFNVIVSLSLSLLELSPQVTWVGLVGMALSLFSRSSSPEPTPTTTPNSPFRESSGGGCGSQELRTPAAWSREEEEIRRTENQ